MITTALQRKSVQVPSGEIMLDGDLEIPVGAAGIVVFAHGSGSSRHSPRNKYVADVIRKANVGTLLFDLLTPEEEAIDVYTRHLRFDIPMLAGRLVDAIEWLSRQDETRDLSFGLFGASTGGGAALVAAAELGARISAVVSRGGRPDLAGDALPLVKAPVLLIVGGWDEPVIELNQSAYDRLKCEKELKIVAGATHLFEEPGKLESVANLAAEFFRQHLS
jgi:dienelactone hydrolase